MDPTWHGKCVDWVNAMRSREGLPVLQRWTDFERCGDAAAKRDAKKDTIGWSISQQIFCDWEPYRPTHQVTCRYGRGEGAFEECANRMWQEKQELTTNSGGALVCKDGRAVEECADGYLQMRGGLKGYNIYDRVACGIHQLKNGNMWISYIFGRGEKVTQSKQLKKAANWPYAPINWDRDNYQRYGFVCGGNKKSHPNGLLTTDCENYDRRQYDDCSSSGLDYLVAAGCVVPTSSPTFTPSRSPSSSPSSTPTLSPSNVPTVSPTTATPTTNPTMTVEEAACDAAKSKKECKRTPGCSSRRDRTCRLLMGTCYGIATKRMCKSAEPCRWMPESNMCIARAESDKVCSEFTSAQKCRKFGCQFGENGLCKPFDGVCSNLLTRKSCDAVGTSFGCNWKNNACIDKSDEQSN